MINQVELFELQLKIAKAKRNFTPQVEVSTLFLERIINQLGELSSNNKQLESSFEAERAHRNRGWTEAHEQAARADNAELDAQIGFELSQRLERQLSEALTGVKNDNISTT